MVMAWLSAQTHLAADVGRSVHGARRLHAGRAQLGDEADVRRRVYSGQHRRAWLGRRRDPGDFYWTGHRLDCAKGAAGAHITAKFGRNPHRPSVSADATGRRVSPDPPAGVPDPAGAGRRIGHQRRVESGADRRRARRGVAGDPDGCRRLCRLALDADRDDRRAVAGAAFGDRATLCAPPLTRGA